MSPVEAIARSETPTVSDLDLEAELLLHCARTSLDAAHVEQIAWLSRNDVDWSRLLQLASRHKVRPLLYWSLKETELVTVPERFLAELKEFFRSNAQRNFVLTRELLQLLQRLEQDGITAIPFKGPVLAESVYGNLALREFLDLDILVQKKDAGRARDLLLARGYRPMEEIEGTLEASNPEMATQYHYPLLREDGAVLVELHWGFAHAHFALSYDHDGLWTRAQSTRLGGVAIHSFSPEDLLLLLCGHGAKHNWERLGWICDVAEMVRVNPELDWKWLTAHAREFRSERVLHLGLYLAHDLLGTPRPTEVWSRVDSDSVIKELAVDVRTRLFAERYSRLTSVERLAFYTRTREKLRDRVPFFYHTARHKIRPNENDRAMLPLRGFFSIFYYLLRPLRLAKVHGLNLLRGIRSIKGL